MTEHDKLALLYMINKTQEVLQHVIKLEEKLDNNDASKYFRIESDLHGLIKAFTEEAEEKGCEVIWEGNQVVKIVEKREEENEK